MELMDAEPWVKGDVFDAVMHYQWYKPVRAYLNQVQRKITLEALYDAFDSLYNKYRPIDLGCNDEPGFFTRCRADIVSVFNTNKYKFQQTC